MVSRRNLAVAVLGCLVMVSLSLAQAPDPETVKKARELDHQAAIAFRNKQFEDAATACRELIKLLPDQPGPHYNLACALARLGKKDDALASLGKAIEVGYGDARHMQQDDDLTNLREEKSFADLLKRAQENGKKEIDRLPIDKGAEIKGVKTLEGNPEGGLRWRLRLSEKATAEQPHRLMVWLHPSGGSMNNVAESLAPRLTEHGWALLVLTQKQYMGWNQDEAERLVEKTLPDVGTHKEVDVRKPVLLGYSAGGQMALERWYADPTLWGGLVLDAAYPVEMRDGKYVARPLPKKDGIKDVPMFVLVGDKDGGSQLWKKLVPEWQKAEVPVSIRYIEGKGHTWLFGKDEVEALEKWLDEVKAGKRPADPVEPKAEKE